MKWPGPQTPDLSTQHHSTPRSHGASHWPSAAEAGQAVQPGFGQDSSRTSSLCPGTLHRPALSPPPRGCCLQPWLSVGLGAQSHIPRLWPPFSALCRLTSGKAALYTPTASCLHSPPCAVVGPLQPRRLRSRGSQSAPFRPLLGAALGTALEAPPRHPPVLRVSFLWRLLAGGWVHLVLGLPRFIYVGVYNLEWGPWAGSSARCWQSERCCLSLCGWTRLSLAPPRTL